MAQPECFSQSISRVVILLLLLQPILLQAAPSRSDDKAAGLRGIAKLHPVSSETLPIKMVKEVQPQMEKAIGIDEWMMNSNDAAQLQISNSATSFTTGLKSNSVTAKPYLFTSVASSALLTTTLNFSTAPTLLSGTALTQGAVYRFSNVVTGIDAKVTLTTIGPNTTLTNIDDNTTNAGRFQPVIRHNSAVKNADSYVRFDFQLVIAGTNTPTSTTNIYLSVQDVDGDGGTNTIREFVEVLGGLTTYPANPTTLRAATPIFGGLNFEQSNSINSQAGIGVDDRFEEYTYLGTSVGSFTLIGGNHNGSTGCAGAACDRQNSWSFDQIDVQKLDFSDAPASYGDAYHPVPPLSSVYFGSGITGDDAPNYTNTDTDDGIASLPVIPQNATSYSVTLACKGTSLPVSAWADFNKNNLFDAGEKIAGTCNGTSVTLNWTGLSGLSAGSTYARFRIATIATEIATPAGTASNGEVEDFLLTITAPVVAGYKSAKLITDADASGSITVGDTMNYTLQFANTGNGAATNFQITDLLPAGISIAATGTQTVLVSGSGTTASANTGYTGGIGAAVSNLLAAGATLGVGGVITVTLPVTISAGATGVVVNQASGTGTGLSAAVLTDNAGTTADLPAALTVAPYNLTIPTSSVAQTVAATVDATTFAIAALTLSLSGKVYEDVNYGGGAGRDFLTSGGVGRPNARVELYNAAGAFVSFTTTNASGDYNFTGLTAGNYTVRVAARTVSSSRIGWVATVLGVQTYRTTANTGTAVPDVNRVGGETPSLQEATNGSSTLAALTTATNTANSISPVTLGATSVTGIDFGFNFDTIVNTNQTGIGSFRQFIFNSNFLDNGPIAQVGQTAGKETSIFMISDGQAHPGVRAGLQNLLSTNGVAVINLPSTLTITDEDTTVDGKTQTANIGNTNSTVLGVGGTVGTDGLSLPFVNGPEVEFTGNNLTNVGLETQSPRATFRGFAIWGFGPPENDPAQADIRVLLTDDTLIEETVLGSSAHSFTDPGDGLRSGSSHVYIAGDGSTRNTTIKNNLIGFAAGRGITALNGNPYLTITGNEIRKNNRSDGNQGGGIELRELTSIKGLISGNFITEHKPTVGNENGIEIVNLTNPGSYSPLTIDNNTFTLNSRGIQIAATPVGISGVTVSHNVFFNNAAGVMINSDGASSGSLSTIISKNSTYNNSGLGIDLRNTGAAGVTANDGILIPNFGNSATDYPIFTSATLEGSVLKVKGYVGSNPAGNPLFAGADIELFLAADDGNNNGNTIVGDGLSKAHGEGKTYLGPIVADANGLFDATLNVSGISPGDFITATSRVTFQTSEFNSNKLVTAPVDVVAFKSAKLTTDADSSGSITAGDTLTWTLQYVNVGTNPVSSFQINDQLPTGFTITATGGQNVSAFGVGTSATKATTYTGTATGTVSNLLASGTLAAGGIITVTIPVTVDAGATGVKINQASGTGIELSTPVLTDNVGATADLPALVTAAPYNLTVPASSLAQTISPTIDPTSLTIISLPIVAAYKSVKLTTDADSSSSITPGDTLTYSLWYKNTGTIDVTTFQINDVLPAGLIISSTGGQTLNITGTTSATKSTAYTGASSGTVADLLSAAVTFKTGDILMVEIPVTIGAGVTGTKPNQANATAGNLPPAGIVTDNVDSATTGLPSGITIPTGSEIQTQAGTTDPTTVTIVAGVNVQAYKSVKLITDADSSGSITPGDTLAYTIHYINLGGQVLNFQINDQLPTGVTISATGGQVLVVAGAGTVATKNAGYTGAASGAVSDLLASGANLNTGGKITATFSIKVDAGFTGVLANQATGFGDSLPPAGIKTDNIGQTSDMPATATAAPFLLTIPSGSVAQTITATIDPTTFYVITTSAPSLTLRKSVTPTGDQEPGTELTYTFTFTNTGGSAAKEVVLTDPVPNAVDFKLGSVTIDAGSTGLTIAIEYSNDFDSGTPTWTYIPVSGGGGAQANFDRNVKAIRWRVTAGNLSSTIPDNSGEVGFTVIIR